MRSKPAETIFENSLQALPEKARQQFLHAIFGEADWKRAAASLRRETLSKPVIFVGAGTCGLAAGAGKTLEAARKWLKAGGTDADIVEVGCIGLCSAEPLLDVQLPGKARVCFQHATADKVPQLLDSVFSQSAPDAQAVLGQLPVPGSQNWPGIPRLDEHPFFRNQYRIVLQNCGHIDPLSLEEYIARGGYASFLKAIHSMTPDKVCDAVLASGLRGRGGGGFPTGRKWSIAFKTDADQKYIVCNADEGDPGAFMDRATIEGDPHRVLEGVAIGAYAIHATKAYVYIRAEYPLAIKNLEKAIKDAWARGLLGDNIYGSGFDLDIVIKTGAGAFVCGEETALIHSIEGKRGMPRLRPPYPAAKGLFGKPTVINNVETFANVPDIIGRGADAFAAIGTKNSKGTKVFALSGRIKRAGLVEIPMGTTIRQIVHDIGGGIENGLAFKAVQIGGPSGGCIPDEHIGIEVDYESLKSVGAMMGSGGLVVMDEKTCMVDVAKFFMDFIQRESCGKCTPCREGTLRMLQTLKALTRKPRGGKTGPLQGPDSLRKLEQLAQVIKDTSLCGLGQTAPNPVLSTLRWFRTEYEAHVNDHRCPAGACAELLSYSIDAAKCKGCTLCARACPAQAISGKPGTPHVINRAKCVSCGACKAACKFQAVAVS
ncbi:MAG: NADH-quinone oxidoreductase subunit NuoF [Elusimicrobia bacterium]|nr:NADH-quinone oxidoreductase subunit NuoF [Elusimicrobiota bacterium]